jgi:hypothetical protein
MEVSYPATQVTWQQLPIIAITRRDNRRGAHSYIHVGCHEAIAQQMQSNSIPYSANRLSCLGK